jgi:hypothetical protein
LESELKKEKNRSRSWNRNKKSRLRSSLLESESDVGVGEGGRVGCEIKHTVIAISSEQKESSDGLDLVDLSVMITVTSSRHRGNVPNNNTQKFTCVD